MPEALIIVGALRGRFRERSENVQGRFMQAAPSGEGSGLNVRGKVEGSFMIELTTSGWHHLMNLPDLSLNLPWTFLTFPSPSG